MYLPIWRSHVGQGTTPFSCAACCCSFSIKRKMQRHSPIESPKPAHSSLVSRTRQRSNTGGWRGGRGATPTLVLRVPPILCQIQCVPWSTPRSALPWFKMRGARRTRKRSSAGWHCTSISMCLLPGESRVSSRRLKKQTKSLVTHKGGWEPRCCVAYHRDTSSGGRFWKRFEAAILSHPQYEQNRASHQCTDPLSGT